MAWRRGAYLSPAAEAWLTLVREVHSGSVKQNLVIKQGFASLPERISRPVV